MSERNGDRARFQKDRKRRLLHRQRVRHLLMIVRKDAEDSAAARQNGGLVSGTGGTP
jgi:phosphopantetheinyl transferase